MCGPINEFTTIKRTRETPKYVLLSVKKVKP